MSPIQPSLIDSTSTGLNFKFKDVQFYDYTKVFSRLQKNKNENYHLTFSFSGENLKECKDALSLGYNVAVPFATKKNENLPQSFLNYPIIDADKTDLRFLDSKNVICGLRVKMTKDIRNIKKAIKDGFIIRVD